MGKKDAGADGFNTPFAKLGRLPRAGGAKPAPAKPAGADAKPAAAAKPAAPARAPAPVAPVAPRPTVQTKIKAQTDREDDRYFEQAMRGATPLGEAERGKRAAPVGGGDAAPPTARRTTARAMAARDDEADALAELADLVSDGAGRTTGGHAPDAAAKLLRELRKGKYPVEADLDLHGRSREEARQRLERFIALAQEQGRRCVRVIHGRGLHSDGEEPVLRDTVQRSLGAGGPDGRSVLAFTLASPTQGGDGATLVLLRKKKARE